MDRLQNHLTFRRLAIPTSVVLLGWYLNQPVPKGFSAPWKLKFNLAIFKMIMSVVKVFSVLGICPFVEGLRKLDNRKLTKVPENINITDCEFDGVKVRLYLPKVTEPEESVERPALVYYHGGGWTLSTAKTYDQFIVDIITNIGVMVVSVDYRRAPEHPFPIPFEDCLKATKCFFRDAATYSVDPKRITIAGDSAGGNLAAAVALKLRDEKFVPMPKNQVLLYPVLQAMDFTLPSFVQNKHGPILSARSMAYFWSLYAVGSGSYTSAFLKNKHAPIHIKETYAASYLNHDNIPAQFAGKSYKKPVPTKGSNDIWYRLKDTIENPYFAPLLAKDVSGLPNAYMFVGQYDVLRDECILYTQRLQEAGVCVTENVAPTGFHGICGTERVYLEAKQSFDALVTFLKTHL